jgi:hypothetical protein
MERMTSEPLDRKLREFRHVRTTTAVLEVLDGVGISGEDATVLPLDEADRIAALFVEQLIAHAESAERWSAHERSAVDKRLGDIAARLDDRRGLWLPQPGTAVEIPVAPLLRAAPTLFVSRASDLQLTSSDAGDGICVELNSLPDGEEFELVAWGRYATSGKN